MSNKRRGNGGRRRKPYEDGASESEDDGSIERSAADLDPSASPEVPSTSKGSSRRNSKGDMAPMSEITLPPLMQTIDRRDDQPPGPLLPPMAQAASALISSSPSESRGYVPQPHLTGPSMAPSASASASAAAPPPPGSHPSAGPNHELPPIATLNSASMNGGPHEHALPPLRSAAAEQQNQQGRRRTSSASTKGSRTGSGFGSKVVACNYCRSTCFIPLFSFRSVIPSCTFRVFTLLCSLFLVLRKFDADVNLSFCSVSPARKTKCDGGHPTCGSCARRSLQCNYVNDPTGANPKGRPRTAGAGATSSVRATTPSAATAAAAAAGSASASASLRSSPVTSSIYLRHIDSNPQIDGNEVTSADLKRSLDQDVGARLTMSNKKMRIMDGLVAPPTAAVAVAVAQLP